jgi:hypothetical protein
MQLNAFQSSLPLPLFGAWFTCRVGYSRDRPLSLHFSHVIYRFFSLSARDNTSPSQLLSLTHILLATTSTLNYKLSSTVLSRPEFKYYVNHFKYPGLMLSQSQEQHHCLYLQYYTACFVITRNELIP